MSENDSESIMVLYRTLVRDLLAAGNPGVVSNASMSHAPIILEELVRSSKKTLSAFCGRKDDAVWTSCVKRAVDAARRRGVDVQVLDASMIDSQALEAVRSFAVADGHSLWLENGRESGDALFAINQPKIASELEGIFDALASRAKED